MMHPHIHYQKMVLDAVPVFYLILNSTLNVENPCNVGFLVNAGSSIVKMDSVAKSLSK